MIVYSLSTSSIGIDSDMDHAIMIANDDSFHHHPSVATDSEFNAAVTSHMSDAINRPTSAVTVADVADAVTGENDSDYYCHDDDDNENDDDDDDGSEDDDIDSVSSNSTRSFVYRHAESDVASSHDHIEDGQDVSIEQFDHARESNTHSMDLSSGRIIIAASVPHVSSLLVDRSDVGLPTDLITLLNELVEWNQLQHEWSLASAAGAYASRQLFSLCEDADVCIRRLDASDRDRVECGAAERSRHLTTAKRQRSLSDLIDHMPTDGRRDEMIVCILRLSCVLSGSIAPIMLSLMSLLRSSHSDRQLPLLMMMVMIELPNADEYEMSILHQVHAAALEFGMRRSSVHGRMDAMASLLPVVTLTAMRQQIFDQVNDTILQSNDPRILIRCIAILIQNRWTTQSVSVAHAFSNKMMQIVSSHRDDHTIVEVALDAWAHVWHSRTDDENIDDAAADAVPDRDTDASIFRSFIRTMSNCHIVHAHSSANILTLIEESLCLIFIEHRHAWCDDDDAIAFLAHCIDVLPLHSTLLLFVLNTLNAQFADHAGSHTARRISRMMLHMDVVPTLVAHLPTMLLSGSGSNSSSIDMQSHAQVNGLILCMIALLMEEEEREPAKYGQTMHRWMVPIMKDEQRLLKRMEGKMQGTSTHGVPLNE